jgi:uncharacterized protein (TIGR00369 family)
MPALRIPPPCDETLGLTCVDKAVPGRTVWQMTADDRMSNVSGTVQGGFLAALADTAMTTAVITGSRAHGARVAAASIELKMSFLSPARLGSTLLCTGEVVRGGRRVSFAEFEITDRDSALVVVRGSSSFLLTELPGASDGGRIPS